MRWATLSALFAAPSIVPFIAVTLDSSNKEISCSVLPSYVHHDGAEKEMAGAGSGRQGGRYLRQQALEFWSSAQLVRRLIDGQKSKTRRGCWRPGGMRR